jgi:ubiquitin C-terminal hydrolase
MEKHPILQAIVRFHPTGIKCMDIHRTDVVETTQQGVKYVFVGFVCSTTSGGTLMQEALHIRARASSLIHLEECIENFKRTNKVEFQPN